MKLYEISNSMRLLSEKFENPDVTDGEREDAVKKYYEADGELEAKIEDCCHFVINTEADIAKFKDKEKELKETRQLLENRIERFKGYILLHMEINDKAKLKFDTFSATIKESIGATQIDDIEEIPGKYVDIIQEIKPKKTEIGKELRAGKVIPGCTLIKTKSLKIK